MSHVRVPTRPTSIYRAPVGCRHVAQHIFRWQAAQFAPTRRQWCRPSELCESRQAASLSPGITRVGGARRTRHMAEESHTRKIPGNVANFWKSDRRSTELEFHSSFSHFRTTNDVSSVESLLLVFRCRSVGVIGRKRRIDRLYGHLEGESSNIVSQTIGIRPAISFVRA